jgi:GNAT superfamily N-acetyltransferase
MPYLYFTHYDAAGAQQIRAVVQTIYKNSYTEAIASGDPFDSVDAFMKRFDAYTSGSGFDMVVAHIGDDPVGQTWGWPLLPGTHSWHGVTPPLPEEFTIETGHRTFILSEIMVRQAWKRQGIAHALHDELLSARTEQRARLLVEPGNTVAYRAYLKWGWRKVGQRRPEWPDAPLFDVLILALPIAR